MLDIGVHFLDLALYITDNWKPTCVSGQVYTKFGKREGNPHPLSEEFTAL